MLPRPQPEASLNFENDTVVCDACMGDDLPKAVNFEDSCVDRETVKVKHRGMSGKPCESAICNAGDQAQRLPVRDLAAYPISPLPYPTLGARTPQVLRQIKSFMF